MILFLRMKTKRQKNKKRTKGNEEEEEKPVDSLSPPSRRSALPKVVTTSHACLQQTIVWI